KHHSGKYAHQYKQYSSVTFHSCCENKFFLFGNLVLTCITYKSFFKTNPVHYRITFVNTGSTVNTFQLGSVSYVNTCRANMYTQFTVYTISFACSSPVLILNYFTTSVFTFSSFMVVSNDNRFVI